MGKLSFEQALARLDEIVKILERGDLPLEESLRVFEEGVRLSKTCLTMLEAAERKVEILLEDKTGARQPRPFAELPDSADSGAGPPEEPEENEG